MQYKITILYVSLTLQLGFLIKYSSMLESGMAISSMLNASYGA